MLAVLWRSSYINCEPPTLGTGRVLQTCSAFQSWGGGETEGKKNKLFPLTLVLVGSSAPSSGLFGAPLHNDGVQTAELFRENFLLRCSSSVSLQLPAPRATPTSLLAAAVPEGGVSKLFLSQQETKSADTLPPMGTKRIQNVRFQNKSSSIRALKPGEK